MSDDPARILDVGVMLPRDLPADQVLDYARAAERAGFAELWVVEDLGFRGGIAQAAAVLAVTDRISVGVGILPVGARNVAFTAMEIATMAELFPGRSQVGLGHGMPGWMRQVGAWPGSMLTLFDEYLIALHALLRGERLTVDGLYVRLDGVQIAAPAVVPPLLAGVRGPKSLALAGRVADGTVLAEPCTPAYVRGARALIAAGPHRVVAYNAAAVDDDDPGAARALVRRGLEWIGDPDWAVHVTPLPFAAELRALREQCGDDRAAFADRMPDEWVDQLAITGTTAQARAALDRLAEAGTDSAVLVPAGPDPLAALDRLAEVL